MSDVAQTLPQGTTDKIIDFIQQQITAVAGSLQTYGPEAAKTIGKIKQLQAIGTLAIYLVAFIFLIMGLFIGYKIIRKAIENYKEEQELECFPVFGLLFIGIIVSVLAFIPLTINFSDFITIFPNLLVSVWSPDTAFVNYILTDVIPQITK